MENQEQESYKVLVKDMEPLSYKDVAEDWEKNHTEWYHALIAIVDLPIVLAIPDLKIYAWCRCKLVADDGSEAHFHWHGLVHFPKRKLQSWKMQCRRAGIKFSSSKNTFKKVICLDHAVGVLRYLGCKDGQRVGRRDGDGLVTHPHTHYSRQPIDASHRHERGKECVKVRDDISSKISHFLDLTTKSNWTNNELHDRETCLCSRGKIGKKKKSAANEKRRAYYKTDAGLETKRRYREKAAVKRQILNQLSMLNVSKKAHLCHEKIEHLVKML
jgi:hypothetical protein